MAIPTTGPGMNQAASPSSVRSPGDEVAPPGFGTLGMAIFLLALGILFAASIVAYLFIRARFATWPPPDSPPLPAGLWISTAVIVLGSASIHSALCGVRRDRQGLLIGSLLITLLLGLVFLVTQTVNWIWLMSLTTTLAQAAPAVRESVLPPAAGSSTGPVGSLYLFTFYVLTGLHALHVIGGMVLLVVVTARAFAGRYSSSCYPGVTYATMYWHFLGAVWLLLFAVLFLR